jgi:hypothetical protein
LFDERVLTTESKKAGSFDPAIQNSPTLSPPNDVPQLACFSGAAAGRFFSIARFRSSARGDRTSARCQEKRIEGAIVVDALSRVGRNAQAHVLVQRIGHGDIAQVRQEPALAPDIGVAHLPAGPWSQRRDQGQPL